jgi:hypothetical protein
MQIWGRRGQGALHPSKETVQAGTHHCSNLAHRSPILYPRHAGARFAIHRHTFLILSSTYGNWWALENCLLLFFYLNERMPNLRNLLTQLWSIEAWYAKFRCASFFLMSRCASFCFSIHIFLILFIWMFNRFTSCSWVPLLYVQAMQLWS